MQMKRFFSIIIICFESKTKTFAEHSIKNLFNLLEIEFETYSQEKNEKRIEYDGKHSYICVLCAGFRLFPSVAMAINYG